MAKMVDDTNGIDDFEENELRNQYEDEEEGKQEEDSLLIKLQDHWLEIGDHLMRVSYLCRFRKDSKWENSKTVYGIMINEEPLPPQYAFYLNTFIPFNSEDHRDKMFKDIKEKLMEFKNVKFI